MLTRHCRAGLSHDAAARLVRPAGQERLHSVGLFKTSAPAVPGFPMTPLRGWRKKKHTIAPFQI